MAWWPQWGWDDSSLGKGSWDEGSFGKGSWKGSWDDGSFGKGGWKGSWDDGSFGKGSWGWSLGKGKGSGWSSKGLGKAKGKSPEKGKGKGKGKGLGKDKGDKGKGLGKDTPTDERPNKKGKPAGTGTTTPARQAARQGRQWSVLEQCDPGSVDCLEKHTADLKKALEKAEKKLRVEKKRVRKEARLGKRAAALEKAVPPSAKRGATPKPGAKPSSAAQIVAQHQQRVRELREKLQQKLGRSGLRSRSASVDPTARGSLEKVAEEEEEEVEPEEEEEDDEEGEEEEEFEEDEPHEEPEKDEDVDMEALGKAEKVLEKAEKPTWANRLKRLRQPGGGEEVGNLEKSPLLVDWHLTLEVDGEVPVENKEACLKLWTAGYDIVLCSYVNSTWRQEEVLRAMDSLEKELQKKDASFKFLGKETVRYKVGYEGKCAVAWKRYCIAAFDDQPAMLKECLQYGIYVYPICTRWEEHLWADHSYSSFADAAEEFLDWAKQL